MNKSDAILVAYIIGWTSACALNGKWGQAAWAALVTAVFVAYAIWMK